LNIDLPLGPYVYLPDPFAVGAKMAGLANILGRGTLALIGIDSGSRLAGYTVYRGTV